MFDCEFLDNSAQGGAGGTIPPGTEDRSSGSPGQGKGGAIFAMDGASAVASNLAFSGNSAVDSAGAATDNADFYGVLGPPPTAAGSEWSLYE
jgi:hypothetical protein